jgi:hypothetical protein
VGRSRLFTHVPVAAVFVVVLAMAGSGTAAFAASRSSALTETSWQQAISHLATPGRGCYNASYPALVWHATKCADGPKYPLAPRPQLVGNGKDYSAVVTGKISQATGTFLDVSSGITEKGQINDSGPQDPNTFTLQLNTQFFSGSPACDGASDPSDCQAWEQFVFENDSEAHIVFMQYWLLDYDATCPSGWFTYSPDCYTDGPQVTFKGGRLTAADLATTTLTAKAVAGGNDSITLSRGTSASTASNADSMVDLASFWNTTEYNIFGDAGGGKAVFGADSTLEPTTALVATSNAAPKCVVEGFTAETNNLTLTKTPAIGTQSSPTMESLETNGPTQSKSCAKAAG